MNYPTFQKVPLAIRDYTVDWSASATGDAIASVAWSVPAGLTNVATSNTSTTATIRLSGGTAGQVYVVVCTVTHASGQVNRRRFAVAVVARIVALVASKDSAASLDYTLDASALFAPDSVASYSWSGDSATIVGSSTAATVRLSGGTNGTIYPTCHVISALGQEDERSIELTIQDL